MVLEQESVAIDGVEQGHGAFDDAICEVVAGQGIVIELVFDGGDVRLPPLWWTPRKGVLSSEIRQCRRQDHTPSHSRRTPYAD
jgi:hypothetical protein